MSNLKNITGKKTGSGAFKSLIDFSFEGSINEALDFSENIYLFVPVIASAIQLLASLVTSDIDIIVKDKKGEIDEEKTEEMEDSLKQDFEIDNILYDFAINYLVYGNVYPYMSAGHLNTLECKRCKKKMKLRNIPKENIRIKKDQIEIKCTECKKEGTYQTNDFEVINFSQAGELINQSLLPNIMFIKPQSIKIEAAPFSGKKHIYFKLDAEDKKSIAEMDGIILEDIDLVLIDAYMASIGKKKDRFLANDDIIHIKAPSIAGQFKYWGVPPLISIFKSVWYVAKLRWQQLKIIENRTYPVTLVYPVAQSDPLFQHTNLSAVKNEVKNAVEKNREGQTDIFTFIPTPVGHAYIGGDVKILSLHNELRLALQEMSMALGVPFELLNGASAQWSSTSAFIRMIEKRMSPLFVGMKKLCKTISILISKVMNLNVEIKLQSLKVLDAMEVHRIRSGLVMNNMASVRTFMEDLGLDPDEEFGNLEKEASAVGKAVAAKSKVLQEAGVDIQYIQAMGAMTNNSLLQHGDGGAGLSLQGRQAPVSPGRGPNAISPQLPEQRPPRNGNI